MGSCVISVNNIEKGFKIYSDRSYNLKETVIFQERNNYEWRKVLDGISFQVNRGEAVALIGHNGCGKSTMLKMLTRIMYPNSGSIKIEGRVACLIELGAGFHPDMSGRENIYINAAIFGLTRKEIDEKIDDIIQFSEMGEFIDNPIRMYSSGMYMRLAFSIAINVNADVLLIDEILAVGDAWFQEKCFKKLEEMKNNGVTIVIVSHDMDAIRRFCDRVFWINNGKIILDGTPNDVIDVYLESMTKPQITDSEINPPEKSTGIIEKEHKNRKIRQWNAVIVLIFTTAISLPLICKMTGININVELTNLKPKVEPEISIASFFNGDYQKEFEAYWNSDYPNHNLITKTYNQIRYSVFGEGASPYTRGREDYVHATDYADEALCLNPDREITKDACYRYVDRLQTVIDEAHSLNKNVSLVLTPNKVSFTRDTLPYYYNFSIPRYNTENADILRQVLHERGISYIDGRECLEKAELECYPLFGKGGIHWTLSAAAEAVEALFQSFKEQSDEKPCIEAEVIGHYSLVKPRYAQDDDIWRVLNIWTKPQDNYVYPMMREKNVSGNAIHHKVLAQGGSFTQPLIDVIAENALADHIDFISYESSMISWDYGSMKASVMHNEWVPISSFDDARVDLAIRDCDWLILEINEASIHYAVSDTTGVGSSYLFLSALERVFSSMQAEGISTVGTVVEPNQGLEENAIIWKNFRPADDWAMMAANRGSILLGPRTTDLFLVLRIPWNEYETFNPGYANTVSVVADGEIISTYTSDGSDEQHVSLVLPAHTRRIDIYTTGIFTADEEINEMTIFNSLYAKIGEAQ